MDLAIDSSGIGLSSTDKRRKREKLKKELVEKNKKIDQLLSACCE